MGRAAGSYIDTHIALWLALGEPEKLSSAALEHIRAHKLLISPMVILELELLHERGRLTLHGQDIVRKLEYEAGALVCRLTLSEISIAALDEKWTRDPFDRLIVANAKANGLSPLVTADRAIRQHYPRAIW